MSVRVRTYSDTPRGRRRARRVGVALDTAGRRVAAYAYDVSNYRIPALGLVLLHSAENVVTVHR